MSKETRIFLASSSELKADRDAVYTRIAELNERWHAQGIFLRLVRWERFESSMSGTRKQDDYNDEIARADIFVLLVHTKVGRYSREEFEVAWRSFQASGATQPRIFTWFKRLSRAEQRNPPPLIDTVHAMRQRLAELKHFEDSYADTGDLLAQLQHNLEELRTEGFITGDVGPQAVTPALVAQVRGSGAAAAGPGAVAAGAGGIAVGGSSHGPITQTVNHIQVTQGPSPAETAEALATQQRQQQQQQLDQQIAHYRRRLADELDQLPLEAQALSPDALQAQALRLSDVYIALDTQFKRDSRQTLAQALSRLTDEGQPRKTAKASEGLDGGERPEPQAVSALEALAHHPHLTLLGSAGSGKSSFGAHVLASLARAGLPGAPADHGLGPAWPHGALLPIRVLLRELAERHAASTAPLTARDLWQHIAEADCSGTSFEHPEQARQRLKQAAHAQGALVLFDGLDECGPPERQARVLKGVQAFIADFGPGLRTLTTARPWAFPKGADPAQGRYQLADLTDEQVRTFTLGWYQAAQAKGWPMRQRLTPEALTDELMAARQRRDLHPLTTNPLLLTLTTTLHLRDRLPDDRADLYEHSVQLLLEKWANIRGTDQGLIQALQMPGLRLADLRPLLAEVAFDAHTLNESVEGLAEVAESRLLLTFERGLGGSLDKARTVVAYIERRAGLLIGKGLPPAGSRPGPRERRFQFPHRTFQEFLAACHLAHTLSPDEMQQTCARLARADPGHWALVLPLAARLASPTVGVAAAEHLVNGQTVAEARAAGPLQAADWRMALLAALMLTEMRPLQLRQLPVRLKVCARIQEWLVAALPIHPDDGGMTASERALAGDLLNQLPGGDPRFDPAVWQLPRSPMRGFLHISADRDFVIGTRPSHASKVEIATGSKPYDRELNDSATPTSAFYIAQYLVTVAQFRAFLQATKREPTHPDVLRDYDNRPVRHVSWHEACDYCRWLDRTLRDEAETPYSELSRLLRAGWQLRLPTELQWEKAARGGLHGRVFSWGDEPDAERANCFDSNLYDTSSVGCFGPNGFGMHDAIGNLWEWTSSIWQLSTHGLSADYPECTRNPVFRAEENCNESSMLVRGGSFDFSEKNARCACRGHHPSDNRTFNLGFRLALSAAPISEHPDS